MRTDATTLSVMQKRVHNEKYRYITQSASNASIAAHSKTVNIQHCAMLFVTTLLL